MSSGGSSSLNWDSNTCNFVGHGIGESGNNGQKRYMSTNNDTQEKDVDEKEGHKVRIGLNYQRKGKQKENKTPRNKLRPHDTTQTPFRATLSNIEQH